MSLLNERDGYKGDMVEDANKYYNENVEGKFEDLSSKKTFKESHAIKSGSKWLYLEESVAEESKEVLEEMEKVVVNGMEYKVKSFDSDEATNKWLEKNKDWGVIKTEKGKVYVAKKSDKGKKIEESTFSEDVKKAGEWF